MSPRVKDLEAFVEDTRRPFRAVGSREIDSTRRDGATAERSLQDWDESTCVHPGGS
jgi:hypothetical protein